MQLLKSLQEKIELGDHNMSVMRIIKGLNRAKMLIYGDGTYDGTKFFTGIEDTEDYAPRHTEKGSYESDIQDHENKDRAWQSVSYERIENEDDTAVILRAAGLEPLPGRGTLGIAKRTLKLHTVSNDQLIDYVKLKMMEAMHLQYTSY